MESGKRYLISFNHFRIRQKSPELVLSEVEIVVSFPSLVFYLYLFANMLVLLAELADLTTASRVFLYLYLSSFSKFVAVITPLPLLLLRSDPNPHQVRPILTGFTLFGNLPLEVRLMIIRLSLPSGVDLAGITFSLLPHHIWTSAGQDEDGNVDFFDGPLDVTFHRERLEPRLAGFRVNKECAAEALRVWKPIEIL
jgi:hypothetical protein